VLRIERDEFVEEALTQANIPLLYIPVKPSYNATDISNKISTLIHNDKNISSNQGYYDEVSAQQQ